MKRNMIEEGSYNMNEKENDEKFLGEFLEGMDKKDEKMCVCGKEMIEKGGFYECPDENYCARKKPVEDQSSVFCLYCKKEITKWRKTKDWLQRQTDPKGLRFVQYFPVPSADFPFHSKHCFFLWVYEQLKDK